MTVIDASDLPPDLVEVAKIGEAWGIKGGFKLHTYSATPSALIHAKRWWLKKTSTPLSINHATPSAKGIQEASAQHTVNGDSEYPRILLLQPHLGRAVGGVGVSNGDIEKKWQGRELACFEVSFFKAHSNTWVAALVGIGSRTLAEQLRGYTVMVARSDFSQPEPDEYYWIDLIGCEVLGIDNIYLGRVLEVFDHGAHAVLKVGSDVTDESFTGESLSDVRTQPKSAKPSKAAQKNQPDHEILIPFVSAYVKQVDLPSRRIYTDWQLDY